MFAEILVLQKRRNLVNVTSVMCSPSKSAVDIEIHREIHQYPRDLTKKCRLLGYGGKRQLCKFFLLQHS
jgi:hypothetical protein